MRFSLRLRQILLENGGLKRGDIGKLAADSGVDRKALAALINNRVRYVSLDHLGAVADLLVRTGRVDPDKVPGIFFRRDLGDLWEMLAERRRLEVCVGVRRDDDPKVDRRWVMASDAQLESTLLTIVTSSSLSPRGQVQTRLLHHMAPAPTVNGGGDEAMKQTALDIYGGFATHDEDRALVGLGSVKSNALVEVMMAQMFGRKPFAPVKDADACPPVYMVYRPADPHMPSCCAGTRLPGTRRSAPGLYYRTPSGAWSHCPSSDRTDAGMILYAFSTKERRLEVVIGGFSGVASECLASTLYSLEPSHFETRLRTTELEMGAIIVRFAFNGGRARRLERGSPALPEFRSTIEHVDPSVLGS